MKFMRDVSSLSSIVGGVLASGSIPFDRILRSFTDVTNGGVVTLTAGAGFITISTSPTIVVKADDYVLFFMYASGLKGLTAGLAAFRISANATPANAVKFMTGLNNIRTGGHWHIPSINFQLTMCQYAVASEDADMTVVLDGTSSGSDINMSAGEGRFSVMVLRNSL